MLDYLKKEANITLTENGAITNASSGNYCLDLFATIGALRHVDEQEIVDRFVRAYVEDSDTAMKILFFARDIRGGLGERRVFRTIFSWLAINYPDSVKKNIEYIGEYGRFDDFLCLFDTKCEKDMLEYIKKEFENDMERLANNENVSLLAKWLPSVNASNQDTVYNAKRIAKACGLSEAKYRKALSALRAKIKIIENNLRVKDYTFDYAKQPSRAMFKYKRAFMRNDKNRYLEYLNNVSNGNSTLHTDNVAPYELVESFLKTPWENMTKEQEMVFNVTWENLPDYGSDENAIAIVDTSGSMYWDYGPKPASVALSLGLYFAKHNKGYFNNYFIEFSDDPQLIEIKGDTFCDQIRYLTSFNRVASTNIEAVFDLILNAAINNNVKQEELATKLVIISDMEFNCCVYNASQTNFNNAKRKFEEAGYKLPQLVFWNVASRNRQQPVTMNEEGVALVSGATPRLFSMIAHGDISPYIFMIETVNSERYAKILA